MIRKLNSGNHSFSHKETTVVNVATMSKDLVTSFLECSYRLVLEFLGINIQNRDIVYRNALFIARIIRLVYSSPPNPSPFVFIHGGKRSKLKSIDLIWIGGN